MGSIIQSRTIETISLDSKLWIMAKSFIDQLTPINKDIQDLNLSFSNNQILKFLKNFNS